MNDQESPSPSLASCWPVCATDEQEAALRVLRSGKLNYWTGEEGRRFEQEYAEYVGQPHAIALANGTVALELALHALGIGPDDEVIVPARTFIATASAVAMCGATPVCADVDPVSQNVTAETLAEKITPRTRALIPVHLAGWPCEMDDIIELAKRHDLKVIEDCAQAHGAEYRGHAIGSFGDAAAFSFCQDKILTTAGEGGMLLLRDKEPWLKAWSHKDHGKDLSLVKQPATQPGFRWLHQQFGTNWRMTEVQSAIGRVVLRKLDGWSQQRSQNAKRLNEALLKPAQGKRQADQRKASFNRWIGTLEVKLLAQTSIVNCPGLRLTIPPSHLRHAYYKWYAFLCPEDLAPNWNRERILAEISAQGVACFSGSCGEIYREAAFAGIHPTSDRLPIAKRLGETSLMLQVDPTLGEAAMNQAAEAIHRTLIQATSAPYQEAA